MSKTRRAMFGFAAVAATAITLAGATVSVGMAQPPAGFEGRRGPPPGAEGPRGPMDPAQRAEALHQRLSITPAQEGAFQAYLAATAAPARGARPDRQAMQGMTTPQRLDAQLAEGARRQADMKVRADAAKRFYSALSAEQRAVFDRMPPQAVLGMGPGGRRGGDRMAMRGGPRGGEFEGRGFRGPRGPRGADQAQPQ
jgi:hypothetical protein